MLDHESVFVPSVLGDSKMDRLREVLAKIHLIAGARLADRLVRRILNFCVGILRKLVRFRILGLLVEPVLARLDQDDRHHFDPAELLRVCSKLDEQHITYWVTGGWGLDVLAGRETRRHSDLDLAINGFRRNLPEVAKVLHMLGYRRRRPLSGTTWFPDVEIFEDTEGHHIEVLSICWDVLRQAQELLATESTFEPQTFVDRDEATPGLREKCTTEGMIQGVAIPTLSIAAQQLFHLGYKLLRPEDAHADDMFRFLEHRDVWTNPLSDDVASSTSEHHAPSTLLLVPVFSFPPDLWRLCRIYHNELDLVPPHVTLAYPFLPLRTVNHEVVRQLEVLFSKVSAFDFELNQVRWFGTDVVYFEPSRSERFMSIIETINAQFPDFHPYGNANRTLTPHVCLSRHGTLADRRLLGRQAVKYLPIASRATQVWLMTNERRADEWSIARIFTLAEFEDATTGRIH